MRYYLSEGCVLRHLERPSVYHIKKDDLYELDEDSFVFLKGCGSEGGCKTEDNAFIEYCMGEGILTKERTPLKRSATRKSPEPSLRYLELQITNRCNLRCKHCYLGDGGGAAIPCGEGNTAQGERRRQGKGDELSVDRIRSVLTEFDEMQGLRVLITGGEPLLHRDFARINEMLTEFPVRKILFSNGLMLNEKILATLNVEEIQISIDGLEYAHDLLRGRGSFNSAIGAVKKAREHGIEVSVATMAHPSNLRDFDGMEELFQDIGIKDWTVDVPCITGRLKRHADFHLSPEEGGRFLRYGHGEGLHSASPRFACGLHLAAVTADGSVSKCTFYADRPVGRIEDGLRECWQRIKPVRLDELACDCLNIESCRGGCRYRAELLGDALGKDYYRCALYDILEKK